MSTDAVLNPQSHALLFLLMQHELQLLSSTTLLSHHTTSIGKSGPEPTIQVVDYAIASCAAASWVTGVIVGNAWPILSDHNPLTMCLALPTPPTPLVSLVPTLYIRSEPSVQAHWWAHLSSPLLLACLQEAISCGNP